MSTEKCVGCGRQLPASRLVDGKFVAWQSSSSRSEQFHRGPDTVHQTTVKYVNLGEHSGKVCRGCAWREWFSNVGWLLVWEGLALSPFGSAGYYLYYYGIDALAERFPEVAKFHVGYVLGWFLMYVLAIATLVTAGFIWWGREAYLSCPAGSVALRAMRRGLGREYGEPGSMAEFKERHGGRWQ